MKTTNKESLKLDRYAVKKPLPKLEDFKDLINSKEVCNLLGISIDTLYKWVEGCKIPYYRISKKCLMFNKRKLIEWLESKEVSPFV